MTAAVTDLNPHRVVKSDAAFRTISEVAEDLNLPQHVLRFWESRFPQIKPLKRGGGRRYYRPTDVQLLRRIRDLLYKDGYTIKGVQKLLRDGTLRATELSPLSADPVSDMLLPGEDDDEAPWALDYHEFEDAPDADAASAAVPPFAGEPDPVSTAEQGSLAPTGLTPMQRVELRNILNDLQSLRQLLRRVSPG